jgi:hypothetical protein
LSPRPHRQRADPQMPPPRLAAPRDHRSVWADEVVEMNPGSSRFRSAPRHRHSTSVGTRRSGL